MGNTYAIILAGGQGKRIGHKTPKQFLNLSDRPVIVHTLEKFNLSQITGIIIVVPIDFIKNTETLVSKYTIKNIAKIIPGGKTRQASSYNAIKCMNFNDNDILVFHDAARPFISKVVILQCIENTKAYGSTGVYVKATDTIAKVINSNVKSIPEREKLFYTQTPQSFKYGIIKSAHEKALAKGVVNPSDDVQLVIDAGYNVKIINGNYNNIKITTPIDLDLAQIIASKA